MKIKLTTMLLLAVAGGSIVVMNPIFAEDSITNSPTKQEWGKAVAGYAMSIATTAGKTHYSHGEPIAIKTTLKNVGTNRAIIVETYPFFRLQANVTFMNNQIVSLTPFGKSVGPTAAVSATVLLPGEAITTRTTPPSDYLGYMDSDYPLSRMFDLSLPGIYRVTMSRDLMNFQNHTNSVTAFSNEIEITVSK